MAAVNSLGAGADSSLYDTAVAAYKPSVPQQLVATPGANTATLTFVPAAGAVSYEAAILPATGDWRVPTDALAPYAPASVQQIDDSGTAKLTFDVPLSAFAYRDGQYKLQVRAVDANGVRGDWSAESDPVTVGEYCSSLARGKGLGVVVPYSCVGSLACAAASLTCSIVPYCIAGAPDAPGSLAVTSVLGSTAVDLSFVPAWLAEQGYQIEVLDKDANTVLDTLTIQASSCSAKAPAPQ